MLITSRNDGLWILPKGHLEPDMTPAESAEQEAWEEAGVTGQLYPDRVYAYDFPRFGNTIDVEMYLLEFDTVHDTWQEADFRERKLLPLEEAIDLVEYKELKTVLRNLPLYVEDLRSPS